MMSIKYLLNKVLHLLVKGMDHKEVIAGLLNRIGKFSINTFNERLAVQKIIFIAQIKMNGFPTNYKYNLYISGPYSSGLANDFYEIESTEKFGIARFKDESLDEKFEKYAEIMNRYKDNRHLLELTGTLIYLEKMGFSGEELRKKLERMKEGFDEEDYNQTFALYEEISSAFS